MAKQPQHFLIVTYPAQGHITPARHLARRLTSTAPGARVTICAPFSVFQRMFPSSAATEEITDEQVAYVAYSDGYDGGFDAASDSYARYMARARVAGTRSLAGVLRGLRDAGRPVTCAVYTLLLPWVADVAREHGVAYTAVFWIQPATALAAYYHYFRGHADAVASGAEAAASGGDAIGKVVLPGLPLMRVRDLPSFLSITSDDDPFAFVLPEFRGLIDAIERQDGSGSEKSSPTYVLANTFDAMEPEALASLRPHVDVFSIGPVLSFLHDDSKRGTMSPPAPPCDLFDHDREQRYIDWLDSKPPRSVVYISFGSSSVMSKKQVTEIADAMAQLQMPFLWVIRKDNCKDQNEDAAIKELSTAAAGAEDMGGNSSVGMVLAWCDQARVLSHTSVACFVTHCGWNSALEATSCGVPMVLVPQYSDQGTTAWLIEQRMGTGVRTFMEDGVVRAAELIKCIEAATSESVVARGVEWWERARAAVAKGGTSDRNLREFLSRITQPGN